MQERKPGETQDAAEGMYFPFEPAHRVRMIPDEPVVDLKFLPGRQLDSNRYRFSGNEDSPLAYEPLEGLAARMGRKIVLFREDQPGALGFQGILVSFQEFVQFFFEGDKSGEGGRRFTVFRQYPIQALSDDLRRYIGRHIEFGKTVTLFFYGFSVESIGSRRRSGGIALSPSAVKLKKFVDPHDAVPHIVLLVSSR
jgi:hypothetical protein